MSSADNIEAEGTIVEVLPNGHFRVKLDGADNKGPEILAYTSGKMRKHYIRIVLGDKVKVEISPYDLSRGRVIFRCK